MVSGLFYGQMHPRHVARLAQPLNENFPAFQPISFLRDAKLIFKLLRIFQCKINNHLQEVRTENSDTKDNLKQNNENANVWALFVRVAWAFELKEKLIVNGDTLTFNTSSP